ncbi:TIGR03086 family metal-binding protein [Nocardioides euryhalodurans]|uniref:TIGR03086 family protein n=1 Tax=Nocardioides euryhalodurans TaxID=2518370 RepID=A0A4V1BDX8_9ACTN|nr:TIGR03086 family metal-binding protein [Nocardioides euryhalodurans]QBR92672.1 TIGR03086 family protein [Nocardioides euryhalodurans]
MSDLDLRPAAASTAALLVGVRDDQLADPTPCPDWTVGDLVDHLGGLAVAFTLAARKESYDAGPSADATLLEPGWRDRVAGALHGLGEAWLAPGAFDGTTQAGPVEMPADEAALVALNEVVVHGWDLASATGQPYDPDPASVAASHAFVESFDAPADDGGLFGPRVDVPPAAEPLHHLLGATGRDPGWTA